MSNCWCTETGGIKMEKMMLVDAYKFFSEENEDFKKEMQIEDILVNIACEFINYRAVHGLTQKDLAEKLQITQAMVSKLESGEYNPTVRMLFEIAQKLSWNFSLQFKSDNEILEYAYEGIETEQSEEYFDNMGLAS